MRVYKKSLIENRILCDKINKHENIAPFSLMENIEIEANNNMTEI